MPSTYAHYRLGQEVIKKLPSEYQNIITDYSDLYNIGLHGPDLLFYFRPLKSNAVNAIGYAMHGRPAAEFFEAAAGVARMKDFSRAYLAYIFGFICHFSLDRECHGYVDEKIAESGVSHAEIEVEFDRRLLCHDGFDPLKTPLTTHIHPSEISSKVISDFFDRVSAAQVYKAEKSMIFYNSLLLAPSQIKRQVIYSLLKISGNYTEMHGLMINYKANPKCRDSNLKLIKLYKQAVNDAAMLICEFCDSAKGDKEWSDLYNYTFSSKYVERNERNAI